MKRDAENKGFTDYQSAYTAYAEEIEAGRVNSQRAMAAAKYLMSGIWGVDFDKIYREEGYKGVNAYMKNGPFKTVYGDQEKTYGEGFLDWVKEIAEANGDIIGMNGLVVASYKKVDGQMRISVKDFKGFAHAAGLSLDQTWDALNALSVYGNTSSDIVEFANALEYLGEESGFLAEASDPEKLGINYKKLVEFAKNSGMTPEQWGNMKSWLDLLNEVGQIELQEVPENWKEAKELGETEWKPVTAGMTIEPDPESVEEAEEVIAGLGEDPVVVGIQPEVKPGETTEPPLGPSPTDEELERASEAERSFYTTAVQTVELFKDEYGNMVEKAVNLDKEGNGSIVYSTFDELGNLIGQRTITVENNKQVSDTGTLGPEEIAKLNE